jgi:hypothetical protein
LGKLALRDFWMSCFSRGRDVKNESRDLGDALEVFQTLKLSCSEPIGCGEPANRIGRGIFTVKRSGLKDYAILSSVYRMGRATQFSSRRRYLKVVYLRKGEF